MNGELDSLVSQANTIADDARSVSKSSMIERTIITSPALNFVTYSLMDAYRILVVHERRHFQQARRVIEESGFPVN